MMRAYRSLVVGWVFRPGILLTALLVLSCAPLMASSIYCASQTGAICYLNPGNYVDPIAINSGFLGLSPGISSIQVNGFSSFPLQVYGSGTLQAVNPVGGCVGGFCGTLGGSPVSGSGPGGGEAVVIPSAGTIKAAAVNGTAIAGFGDTLTLSQAGAITLNGNLTGLSSLTQGQWSLRMGIEFYDPSSFMACGDGGTATCAYLEGGVQIADTFACLSCTYGPGDTGALSYPFSTSIDLPAGDTTMFVYLFLQTSQMGLDFSDPLQFNLTAPTGDTLTSLDGVPIVGSVSSVPEPSALPLLGGGLAGFAGLLRRKQSR